LELPITMNLCAENINTSVIWYAILVLCDVKSNMTWISIITFVKCKVCISDRTPHNCILVLCTNVQIYLLTKHWTSIHIVSELPTHHTHFHMDYRMLYYDTTIVYLVNQYFCKVSDNRILLSLLYKLAVYRSWKTCNTVLYYQQLIAESVGLMWKAIYNAVWYFTIIRERINLLFSSDDDKEIP